MVTGDALSLNKLPGVAEVAMQTGLYAANRIKHEVTGRVNGKPFRYRDLGTAAYISRGRAVVKVGRLHLSGFIGWWVWLFIHIGFLTGLRSRLGTLLSWWLAFTRDLRRERVFTIREVGFVPDIYTATLSALTAGTEQPSNPKTEPSSAGTAAPAGPAATEASPRTDPSQLAQ